MRGIQRQLCVRILFVALVFLTGVSAVTPPPAAGSAEPLDVEFKSTCPDLVNNQMIIGQKTKCIVSIINHSSTSHRVLGLTGAFTNPSNFSQVLYNLTSIRYVVNVKVNQEAALPFIFTPEVEPMDYGFVVKVEYADEDERIRLVPGHKSLVKVVAKESWFDLKSLSTFVVLIAMLGGVAYSAFHSFLGAGSTNDTKSGSSSTKKSKGSSRGKSVVSPVSSPLSSQEDLSGGAPVTPRPANTLDLDWIPEQHLKPARKRGGKK